MRRHARIYMALITVILLLTSISFAVSAETITTTVDLSNVRKNERGDGYNWDNINDVLTLTNYKQDTEEDYGFKLPHGATVVIQGNCSIKAKKGALTFDGSAIIKGSGTLKLEAEVGMINLSNNQTAKVIIYDGNYVINAESCGIRSEYVPFTVSGGKMDINVANTDGYALYGTRLSLANCGITANSGIYSYNELSVKACALDITANGPALSSSVKLTVKDMAIEDKSGAAITEYNGESAIVTSSTYKRVRTSILFGESVPAAVDYLIFLLIVVLLAAVIVLPILRQRKKDAEKRALYEAAHPPKAKKTTKK
ncbi:MAG: hypothetical protein IJA85_05360 [Clostridia bacterium]|nr:hypothetical protein [Clostridia bacterium]